MRRLEARGRLTALLAHLSARPHDEKAAWDAADLALTHGFEEEAIGAVTIAAELSAANAGLWQFVGLLHRAIHDSAPALEAFERALALDPSSARAAHAIALTSYDAGLPAIDRYDRAIALAPGDGDVRLGRAAALAAEGLIDDALNELTALLAGAPGWLAGHQGFARLSALAGRRERAADTIETAIARAPADDTLHVVRLAILAQTADHDCRFAAIDDARRMAGALKPFAKAEAIAFDDAGHIAAADRAFDAMIDDEPRFALARVRHELRAQRPEMVDRLAAALATSPEAVTAWAYRATAWRMLDDPRTAWLEPEGAVAVFDLTAELPPLGRLAETLRAIHVARAQPLDQSVRGGTQTDGPLFARLEPEIRQVRDAVVRAVRRYVEALPTRDPDHPLLARSRDVPVRFSGSWSVRLGRAGRHANHVHQLGWLSSALYIALPESGEIGHLSLGAPPDELGLAVPPTRTIVPRPGHLALFPSTTWHGTSATGDGERLTIAFDVAPPPV